MNHPFILSCRMMQVSQEGNRFVEAETLDKSGRSRAYTCGAASRGRSRSYFTMMLLYGF